MGRLLYRLGHLCVRRRRLVAAIWLAIIGGLIALVAGFGAQTSDNLTLPGTGSTEATNLLDRYLPKQANGTNPIVIEAPSGAGKLTDSKNKKAIEDATDSLAKAPDVISAVSPFSSKGADQLSDDKTVAYISLTLSDGPSDLDEDTANEVIAAADSAVDAGLEVSAGGYLGQEVSTPSTRSSEVLGIAAAIAILLVTFGTAVAMAMPITTAIVGLVGGLCAIALVGHLIEIPTVAPTLGTMIGLGVGIDYSLFIVTRYRTRRAEGLEVEEAIARAVASAGSAVAFAGGTVVIALCSLALSQIPIVSALGYSAALVVLVAAACALTLLPAVLGMLGDRIESLKIGWLHRRAKDDKAHGWERWARGVGRRPWPAMLVAVVVLVGLAVPALGMTLGQQDNGQFPTSTTIRESYDALSKGFGVGINGPLLIAVKFDPKATNDQKKLNQLNQQYDDQQQQAQQAAAAGQPPPSQAEQDQQQQEYEQQKKFLESDASDPDLVHLENQIKKTSGVKSVSQAKVDSTGTAAVFNAVARTSPSDEKTSDLVDTLRNEVIPKAAKGTGMTVYVGGSTASYIDLADRIGEKLPFVIAVVVALSFLLLMLAFRSILVPLTAALMNLLSVAAAYGILTAVFEDGFLISLIGLDHTIPIVSFVPLLMFAILFGLSMDYQVFLVGRIDERYRKLDDNHEAVVEGLSSSARVITAAALIMVTVFSSFVINGNPTVKQFGVGMAAAIAVDATIVRCLLVPSVMVLLGRSNWWLPGWIDRILPQIGLESEDKLPPLPEPEPSD